MNSLIRDWATVEQKETLRDLKRRMQTANNMVEWGIWYGRYEAMHAEVLRVAEATRDRAWEKQKDIPSGMADD